jgi:homoserine kinase
MSRSARAFAPASVGNIGVGFDLLGHAVDGPRDIARVTRIDDATVRIDAIEGGVAGVDALPREAASNTH